MVPYSGEGRRHDERRKSAWVPYSGEGRLHDERVVRIGRNKHARHFVHTCAL